jgi:hypothetical protein
VGVKVAQIRAGSLRDGADAGAQVHRDEEVDQFGGSRPHNRKVTIAAIVTIKALDIVVL